MDGWFFPWYWEWQHPNWRPHSIIFQRGRAQPPTSESAYFGSGFWRFFDSPNIGSNKSQPYIYIYIHFFCCIPILRAHKKYKYIKDIISILLLLYAYIYICNMYVYDFISKSSTKHQGFWGCFLSERIGSNLGHPENSQAQGPRVKIGYPI
jgi:hypothetical protein